DADVAEHFAEGAAAFGAHGEGVVGERLLDVEGVAAVGAAVGVRGHRCSYCFVSVVVAALRGLEGGDAFGGDRAVDGFVVEFGGYSVEEFGLEDDSIDRRWGFHGTDEAVEVAASPAESHSCTVDGGGGDEHEVDVVDGHGAEEFADRF